MNKYLILTDKNQSKKFKITMWLTNFQGLITNVFFSVINIKNRTHSSKDLNTKFLSFSLCKYICA